MKDIVFCMTYNTCNRCPLNRKCEEEYKKEMEQKSGECGGSSDLSVLWDSPKRTPMPKQEEPTEER